MASANGEQFCAMVNHVTSHRAFSYRFYPTPRQEQTLVEWDNAMRFLWNIAHEQRLAGLARTDKRYPTLFDQQKELTALRADLPWLRDVPRGVSESLLSDLYDAWLAFFRLGSRKPKWRKRSLPTMSFRESHSHMWSLKGGELRFPKLGSLRIVMHRPLIGRSGGVTIRRDGGQWFAVVVCAIRIEKHTPRSEPVVGIDRGVTFTLADSDGKLTKNPRHYEAAMARLARAQRVLSRKEKGSNNREKAQLRVMRIHRKVRRQREHFLHVESARYAKSHGVVVLERLNVESMMRGMGRGISGAGWSMFAAMLRYKLTSSGGSLVEVPAQYSSQTCSACGTVDAKSRQAERFCCTGCGHTAHADTNAALVLLDRFQRPGSPWSQLGEGSLLEGTRRPKKRLRVSRRKAEVTL